MDVTVPCPCPGAPHPDGDTVTLRDKPTLHMGITAMGWAGRQSIDDVPTTGEIMELYLRDGIVDWTFTEEDGSPKPINSDTLQWLLDDYELAYPIAEQATDLYTERVFRPLVSLSKKSPSPTVRRRRSSPRGPTPTSTSAS